MESRAFTLIELVMVMVILGIIAAVSIPVINSYQAQHLYAAAERVAADLRYAKGLSISASKWYGISFQAAPVNTYSLYQTDGTTDTNIKFPQYPDQDYIVNLNNDYQGVSISAVNISGGNKVEFNAYGSPYDDASGPAIAVEGVITLARGSSSITVRITPTVGRVYIQ